MPEKSGDRQPTKKQVPVIDLSKAPGEGAAWGRPRIVVYLWAIIELIFVTNPWQISSNLRVKALRLFGAKIGQGVVFRPRTRVKFPWNLSVGDRCWIGEGVWIHNQAQVVIGHDVVISQESMITTGSHAHRADMALLTKSLEIDSGAWITSRCMILGGSHIGRSALITPMSVVAGVIPANSIAQGNYATKIGERFA
ncbi:acetyltransferase [Arthrobacter sp. STN4]|nr:acetyltransferase [Arthrobacter sp. STN4]